MSKIAILKNFLFFMVLVNLLASCGTQLSCKPEIGAPPEREFWCSPITKIGNFFTVSKQYTKVKTNINNSEKDAAHCEETIGEKECNIKQ